MTSCPSPGVQPGPQLPCASSLSSTPDQPARPSPLLEADGALELVEEPLVHGMRLAAHLAQGLERLLLLGREVGRDDHADVDDLVAPPAGAQVGHSVPVQPEDPPILGSRRDLEALRALHRGDLDAVAQRRLDDRQRQLIDDVGAVALEHRVGLDVERDVKVARLAAPRPGLALPAEADLGAAVDPGRDAHAHLLLTGHVSRAGAATARLLDDLALSAAAGAGGDVDDLAEDGLRRPPDLARAAALRAALGRGPGLRPAALAAGAGLGPRDGQLPLGPEDRILEADAQVEAKVLAALGTGARPGAHGASEEGVEDVFHAGKAAAEVEAGHALRARVAEGVVALPLGGVAQDLVSLVDLLEAGLGLGVVGIAVGMVLEGELAIGALELLTARA